MAETTFSIGPFDKKFHIGKLYLFLGILYVLYFFLGTVIGMISYNWVFPLLMMDIILAQSLYDYYKNKKRFEE